MNSCLRLGNLVKEFNVGPNHIINFLSDKGIFVDKKLTTKLSEEAYLLLQEKFKTDKLRKKKADEISIELSNPRPLPRLKNWIYETICFECAGCNRVNDITVRDSDFVLQSNESFKVWLFELDFECKNCNEEINLHFEIEESTNSTSNHEINFTGANICNCPNEDIEKEDESTDDDTEREDESTDYDPYENFHWGGLGGEEAYIGYWNTD